MEFPKMLYRSGEKFADADALKTGLHIGTVKTLIASSADAQTEAEADGWAEDLSSLIRKKPGPKPKTEGAEA
ncbi:hypothetical protein M3I54_22570 [Paraburkholderia sp. CNPSo 3274]|uniref:hypothetical protein n=1 Tax=Paraburkholderia sp. CNPSo 3274 TaxID=2940932 RepID=UPI0020B67BAC|nr:hypothetical protein [Paraburkholderia sp. CNPSo 3274]MCP3709731.1 hypothetical protein [Paraburkholderia sp. CNPSo 3274]